jgi:hypothetical protein
MIDKEKINKWFTAIIIIILAVIIFLQRSCEGNRILNPTTVTTKTDTIWKFKHDTIIKNVKISKIIHVPVPADPKFHPSDNIDTCKARFNNLLKDYLTKRVYADTLKLDSLGTIIINDTVFMNTLGKRTKIYDYKIPIVTKTVTITKQEEPKRQLYIGGELFTDATRSTIIVPSLIYKDRKDRIYQINIGFDNKGSIYYGGGLFWKIKLHK